MSHTHPNLCSDPCLIISSLPDLELARQLGAELIERQLAACVKLLPQAEAIYSWDQQIQHDREIVMWVKTLQHRVPDIETLVRLRHPYQTPEFLVINIDYASSDYRHWLHSTVAPSASSGN